MARSGKSKARGKKRPASIPENSPSSLDAPSAAPFSPVGFFRSWAGFAFFAAAAYAWYKNQIQPAEALLFLGLLFQGMKVYAEQRPPWMVRLVGFWASRKAALLLGLWAVFAAVTLTFPNFSWLFPRIAAHLPFQQSLWISMILFAGMALTIRLFPEKDAGTDLSPGFSRFLLLICLAVGAFLRLYHASKPMGSYSIDCASDISVVRQVVDISNYQGLSAVINDLLPLWFLTGFSFWHLLPDASSLLIQRLSCTALDLGAIWVLYYAGKEIGGRRMGLIAAALAAVSKPLIALAVSGYPSSAMTLGMALVLLFTLRLVKNPDIPHFLSWGASVGFLAFTFIYFQPYIPFFIFTTLIWMFWEKRKHGDSEGPGLAVWSSAIVLLLYFLYFLNAFSSNNWISRLVDLGGVWVPCVVLGAVLIFAGLDLTRLSLKGTGAQWAGWMIGAWLAAVLSFPAMTNPMLLGRIRQHALVGGGGFLSGAYLTAALQRMTGSFQKLFWAGGDRSDMSLPEDAFFGYPEVLLIALGLAFCLARPNTRKMFILLTAAVGIALHAFATETHSLRLLGCPPPFILLGAWGMNELLNLLFGSNKGGAFSKMIFIFLALFWVWGAWGVFSRVHTQWAEKPMAHTTVRNAAIQDVDHGYWVFLAPNLSDGQLTLLYEGHPVHLWHNTNLVAVGSDETGPDAVVFTQPDENFKKALTQAFPEAAWSEVHNSDLDPARSAAAYRCQIPFAALSNPKQNLIKVARVQAPYWRRQFVNFDCGLGFGFLSWEDKTASVNDAVPPEGYLDDQAARYEGVIHLDKGGDYEITCTTPKRTKLLVDGQTVINFFFPRTATYMAPEKTGKKVIQLSAGDHRVEVTTSFQVTRLAPGITLQPKGAPGPGQSLWNSFKF